MANTTTNMYQGLQDGKPSSRVLAPPGGGSSISFGAEPAGGARLNGNKKNAGSDIFGTGDGPDDGSPQKPVNQRNNSDIFGVNDDPSPSKAPTQAKRAGGEEEAGRPAGKTNPPGGNPVTGGGKQDGLDVQKKQRGGFNPITGEAYGAEEDQPRSKGQQQAGGASTRPW